MGRTLAWDGRGSCRDAKPAPLESASHTRRQKPGAQRVFAPHPANLYHLFTNISADCARSRARMCAPFARLSAHCREGTWGTTHPMIGAIFITAVGGPANTCGKTRPL